MNDRERILKTQSLENQVNKSLLEYTKQ